MYILKRKIMKHHEVTSEKHHITILETFCLAALLSTLALLNKALFAAIHS